MYLRQVSIFETRAVKVDLGHCTARIANIGLALKSCEPHLKYIINYYYLLFQFYWVFEFGMGVILIRALKICIKIIWTLSMYALQIFFLTFPIGTSRKRVRMNFTCVSINATLIIDLKAVILFLCNFLYFYDTKNRVEDVLIEKHHFL